MKINKVSSVRNQILTSGSKVKEKSIALPKVVKDNKNKLAIVLAALSAATIAGIVIYKGKGTKLSNIVFDKGTAFTPKGNKFTGTIKDRLANGDKIVMKYTDGILQKSTRSGEVNFEKVYETINNEKIVKKTANEVTSEFNITKTQQEVESAQKKLKSILEDKYISADELQYETDVIKFKSTKQKEEILNAYKHKKEIEHKAQMRQRIEQMNQTRAQIAQNQYNKPFKDKLSNKSARESAEVFIKKYDDIARNEALSRIEQENKIKEARAHQDSIIKEMQHPSGKSAQESAEVFEHTISQQEKCCRAIAKEISEHGEVSRAYIDEYAKMYGYKAVNEIWKIGGEDIHIIYEGFDTAISSDGRIFQCVIVQNGLPIRSDITDRLIETINEERVANNATKSIKHHIDSDEDDLIIDEDDLIIDEDDLIIDGDGFDIIDGDTIIFNNVNRKPRYDYVRKNNDDTNINYADT